MWPFVNLLRLLVSLLVSLLSSIHYRLYELFHAVTFFVFFNKFIA